MLSYRHAFHAGNHADVLKHLVLVQLLRHLVQKDKPFCYIDTHAGAGSYALDSRYARQNAEYDSGIGRLWGRTDLPAPLEDYVAIVRALNPAGKLRVYPGSPLCALPLLRGSDRMRLFELHSTDSKLLQQAMAHTARRVTIQAEDGFNGLRTLLPPPSRRALVLIDPPYEERRDYARVLEALRDSLVRFATGIYAVWYPQLQRPESRRLPERLKQLRPQSWLHVSLSVHALSSDGYGMHGSGLFVVNPPWSLPEALEQVMPWLVAALGQDGAAEFALEHAIP
jgi:23S rRNA (adenine2030-N6)-methyltransferase